LNKDLGAVDLTALPKELTAQQVIAARLDEIDRALDAGAPLAVIFLVGSTLEGLLAELSLAHASTFASAAAAPRVKGTVKPLDAWTLSELITVSHALGLLGEDVAKHADQVRNSATTSTRGSTSRRTSSHGSRQLGSPSRFSVQLWRTFSRSPTPESVGVDYQYNGG
jgi:hypothetical protein